jgi:hypothetical protein
VLSAIQLLGFHGRDFMLATSKWCRLLRKLSHLLRMRPPPTQIRIERRRDVVAYDLREVGSDFEP